MRKWNLKEMLMRHRAWVIIWTRRETFLTSLALAVLGVKGAVEVDTCGAEAVDSPLFNYILILCPVSALWLLPYSLSCLKISLALSRFIRLICGVLLQLDLYIHQTTSDCFLCLIYTLLYVILLDKAICSYHVKCVAVWLNEIVVIMCNLVM